MSMQVSIPKIKYSDDENRARELVEYLCECENCNMLSNILSEIIDNIVYNQNKDVIGIINDYEYIKVM